MGRKAGLLLCAAAMTAAPVATAAPGSRYREPLRTQGGAVSAVSPQAGAAAVAVLDAGGNAMDAAVTAVFAVGVARPEFCGIGGGGFLVHRAANGRTDTLDFREQAPADYTFGQGVTLGPQVIFGTGHNVVGVPGTVAGMAAALERHGTISLSRAIAPAERLAREGVAITDQQAAVLSVQAPRLLLYREAAEIYLDNGLVPYSAGDRLVQTQYADDLAEIAKDGPRAFYEGRIAKAIAASMPGSPLLPGDAGTMTTADLATYEPIWRPAISMDYRGARVATVPPPTSGGVALLESLQLLEGLSPAEPASADRFHFAAEAQKIAWADRARFVGDPRFTTVPTDRLTSAAYADKRRREISAEQARSYPPGPEQRAAHTTHVSVIDAAGNAVAITCTIEQPAGSAVVAPGTGFLLNNQLTDFNVPGTGTAANDPAPGKRPRSSITPVVVSRRGQPVLAVGAAGGPSIIGGVLSTLVNVLDHGMNVAEAVDAARADPRAFCDGDGTQLCIEDGRVEPAVLGELERRGHVLTRLGDYLTYTEVEPVGVDPATGERLAVSDPRGESGAAVQTSGPRRRLRLRVTPRTVRAGRSVVLRFAVRDTRRISVGAAEIRLAGRRLSTNAAGRARLRTTFARPGVRRVSARRVGAVPSFQRVRVLREAG